jgi:AcrR family transcriptional regulator
MRAIVIDETIRCILEEGFAAASAKHITERAGVTWGVVQYHFGDRDGSRATSTGGTTA